MGKTNMVEIDTSATREAVYDSGKTLAVLSEEIGRCPSYLSYAVNKGLIPEYAFRRLCVLLGVSEGDLLKKRAVTPPSKSGGGSRFGLWNHRILRKTGRLPQKGTVRGPFQRGRNHSRMEQHPRGAGA